MENMCFMTGMENKYSLLAADGVKFVGVIHNSIFRLAE